MTKDRLAYFALISILMWLTGCRREADPQNQITSPAYLIVALDRSDSTSDARATMLNQLDVLAGDADSARAMLDVWAYDTTPVRIWGPNLSKGAKELTPVKQTELSPNPKHPRHGTRPGLLLDRLASEASVRRQPSDRPLRIVLLTDGGIDHADDPALLRTAARRLAKEHKNLKVLVIGIESQERRTWDSVVGGELPHFKAVTWSEAEQEIRQLHLEGNP